MRINTNIQSLFAQRSLEKTSKALGRALERLASGKRINHAGDDAAGLAIGTGLDAQARGLSQATRNINDAKGLLSTADGAMSAQIQLLQRMRELAMQSASGTYSSNDRVYMNTEFQQLFTEFKRITDQTNFNGTNLFDGSLSNQALQVGTRKGETISLSLPSMQASSLFVQSVGSTSFTAKYSNTFGSVYSVTKPIVGDLNGDGYDDMIEFDDYRYNRILINDGTGQFTQAGTVDRLDYNGTPTLVDVNNDGKLDLIQNNTTNAGVIWVSLGTGRGTFTASQTLSPGGIFARDAISTGDFNGDGKLDFIATNSSNTNISVYLGSGDGTFTSGTTLSQGQSNASTGAPVVLDLNGDGKLDILQVTSSRVSTLLGNGDGTFTVSQTINGTFNARPLMVDVNRDNRLDLVVTNGSAGNTPMYTFISNGDGTFQSAQTNTVAGSVQTPIAGDINNDGIQDILVNYASGTGNIAVRLGRGDGTYTTGTTIANGFSIFGENMILKDLDNDGNLDLIAGNQNTSGGMYVYRGKGDGTFYDPTINSYAGSASYYGGVVLANLNGDDYQDIVATSHNGNPIASSFVQGSQTVSAVNRMNLNSQTTSQNLLEIIDTALSSIYADAATIGALQNRLDSAQNVTEVTKENITAAKSQIMDSDVAAETAELTRNQILQQAGVSVLGQANVQMQMVLSLLKP